MKMQHRNGLIVLAMTLCLWGIVRHTVADPAAATARPARQAMLWDRLPLRTNPNGLPVLHSLPGAPVSLFIDFEYESVNGQIKPFSLDGDPKTFTQAEQKQIHRAWAKVAGAFAPFDVDVTTVEPKPDHPYIWQAVRPGGGSSGTTMYVPLTGQKTASNGSQRADGYRFCGGAGSILSGHLVHESGHAQGIVGHEAYDEDGNYIGIQRAGIERGPFTRSVGPIGAWHVWLSEHGHPTKNPAGLFWVVNDIEQITGAIVTGAKTYSRPDYDGDGFRPDDHGDDITHAARLSREPASGVWSGVGVIERYADRDVFSLDWPGGAAWIGVQTPVPDPLLDARLAVYGSDGTLIALADPPESMQVALRVDRMPAGKVYLEVSSDGDYSELGRYELTVSAGLPLSLAPIAHLPLDERSLKDLSGQRRDGRWDGAAAWTESPHQNSAAAFHGASRIIIPPGNRGYGRTFAFWFKTDNAEADGEQVLLSSPGKAAYRLYLEGAKLKAHAINDGGLSDWVGGVTLTADAKIQSGHWYHAALTHRTTFSKIEDTIALYLDGKEVARGPAGPVPASSQFDVGGPTFVGAVDDVRIFGEVVPSHLIAEFAHRGELSQSKPTDSGVNVTANATHDSVALRWEAPTGAKGYEILRSVDNQHFAVLGKVASGTTTLTDTGLEASRRYFYCVRAEGGKDAGAVDVTTRGGPVHRPRFIRVKKHDKEPSDWGYHRYGHKCEGEYGITLLWFGPYGHRDRSIRIERSTDGKTFTPIITLPSIERVYYDTNLTPRTKYTYRFVTIDDDGEAGTAVITATSASPPPATP